jgi:hypothetical protein
MKCIIRFDKAKIEYKETSDKRQYGSPDPKIDCTCNRRDKVNKDQRRRLDEIFQKNIDNGGEGQHCQNDQELPYFLFFFIAHAFSPIEKQL